MHKLVVVREGLSDSSCAFRRRLGSAFTLHFRLIAPSAIVALAGCKGKTSTCNGVA